MNQPTNSTPEPSFDSESLLLRIRETHAATQSRLNDHLAELATIQQNLNACVHEKLANIQNETGFEFNLRVTEILDMENMKGVQQDKAEDKLKSFYAALMSSFDQFFEDSGSSNVAGAL
ncbi:hypothetical protein BCR33DRAFT_846465, partial [Rhizoclosmatium globosum]